MKQSDIKTGMFFIFENSVSIWGKREFFILSKARLWFRAIDIAAQNVLEIHVNSEIAKGSKSLVKNRKLTKRLLNSIFRGITV